MTKPELILASQSPRRAMLLREAGYAFRQVKSPFSDPAEPERDGTGGLGGSGSHDDRLPLGASEEEKIAMGLALRKAFALAKTGVVGIVLSADTLGISPTAGRELIGTPTTGERAREMLMSMRGKTHEVITGVTIYEPATDRLSVFADTARVTIGELTDAMIDAHIEGGAWKGKAGGYNLAEVADSWPIGIEAKGDPGTVMGLPMRRLVGELAGFGVRAEGEGG